jgi:hypothetical protein
MEVITLAEVVDVEVDEGDGSRTSRGLMDPLPPPEVVSSFRLVRLTDAAGETDVEEMATGR